MFLVPIAGIAVSTETSNRRPPDCHWITGPDVIALTVIESLAHIPFDALNACSGQAERSSVSKLAQPIVSSGRLRQSSKLEPPQESPKSERQQVLPRHCLGTNLAYCLRSLKVRSGIPGSNVLAPEARRTVPLNV
jgi:hypothetical protein